MVKHIIIWNLKDELSAEEKKERCRLIKQGLEGLAGLSLIHISEPTRH